MKNFTLITNIYKDPNLFLTGKIAEYIESHDGRATTLVSAYRDTAMGDFTVDQIPQDTECILVLGGDGTLIRAATKVESLNIPLIGVNLGTMGYLCELEALSVYPAIDSLMQDRYMMDDRIMLTGYKKGLEKNGKTKVALNDIVIHNSGLLQTVHLNVYVNGEFLYKYNADGIIVATPTGSTGYSMSAGGPIVDPNGNMIIMTPSNAHTLNSKSIVLNGEDEIEIELVKLRDGENNHVLVSCDGDKVAELHPGERFVIAKAENVIHICKLHKRSFLEILRKKMGLYT